MTTAQITAGDYGEKTIVYYWDPIGLAYVVGTQPGSGSGSGLTDAQLRATPVPVSGTVTANAGTNLNTSALALDATLTGGTQKSKLVDTGGTNVASVSAAGALKVDASGVAVPITDNAGSLTVDAPVATPVFVRLSDGAAAIATLPVSLATNTPDVTDRAGRLVGVITAANLDVALSTRLKPADTLAAVTNLAQLAGTAPVMKAASTAAAAADVALVVAISPNSPITDTASATALASASRGAATVNTDITNFTGKGIRVWQDLTVLGASSVCTFSVSEKDPASGKFISLLASAATGAGINSTGTARLTLYPGLTAAANSIANDVLPRDIRIVSTVATAASTFSIGYSLIP